MVQPVRVLFLFFFLPASLALLGCSAGTTETLSASTTSPTTGASEGAPTTGAPAEEPGAPVYHCCLDINGEKSTHACPDDASARECSGLSEFDIDACLEACGEDPACIDGCFAMAEQMMTEPDPSACPTVDAVAEEWCKPPPAPGSDCTAGMPTCEDAGDCFDKVGPGTWCNSKTRRCFNLSDSCIGTPCTTEPNDDDGDNRDCGSGGPDSIEFCSNETGTCEAL